MFGGGNMRRTLSLVALFAVATLVVGCQAIPEVPYDRSSSQDIKTIGVVTPKFPDDPNVILASTVGQSFGLVGALIDAGMQANRESRLKSALGATNFAARDAFLNSVTAALQAQGYTVTMIPTSREKDDFLSVYPTDVLVDAYLDLVTPRYGYLAAGISDSTPYRPIFAVKARLVRARDSSVLMQDTVVYNPVTPNASPVKGVITVAPNPALQFVNFGSLESNPELAARGLRSAMDECAQTVAQLLK